MTDEEREDLNRRRQAAGWEPITDKRNDSGVKDSANMYRSFGGAHYPHYAIEPSPEFVARLRAAGTRCRLVGVELFIHIDDRAKADTVHDIHH